MSFTLEEQSLPCISVPETYGELVKTVLSDVSNPPYSTTQARLAEHVRFGDKDARELLDTIQRLTSDLNLMGAGMHAPAASLTDGDQANVEDLKAQYQRAEAFLRGKEDIGSSQLIVGGKQAGWRGMVHRVFHR